MRQRRYMLAVLLLFPAALWSQTVQMFPDPLNQKIQFISAGHDSTYFLPHRFLVSETVTIQMDSITLIQGKDFNLQPVYGRVHFLALPDSGRTVSISYRYMPVGLNLQYQKWTVADSTEKDSVQQKVIFKPKQQAQKSLYDEGEMLQRSGSIFRGISIGTNQSMRLQSGLRLQVSGKIAANVEVVASLTDQNTPIQPEGNTQTLQEIDKVFVKIKGPGFRTTLGDYVFNVQGNEFGSYTRKLQGMMGILESSRGSVTLAAAASKGEFTTNHFMGQEGNQGPYQLTGTQGLREIIILAGTERVWIDGELMTRGEDNDYTIEYANGQITFTRNRLITEDSRITVDFEYSSQRFQKEIYGGMGEVRFWDERVQLKASFLREADDKDNPLDIILSDSDRERLAMAGDDPDSAVTSGEKYVGENKGAYVKVDSLDTTIYRYLGIEKGDYVVRFSYAGNGKGDYSFQGYGIYRYEGPGQGDYLPISYLPVASSHQLADFAAVVDVGKGIRLSGEMGVSDLDKNTYSSRDDGDNAGLAYQGKLDITKRNIQLFNSHLGEWKLSAQTRKIDNRFRPVGRTTEIEHGRKWGIEEGTSWGENSQEIHAGYYPLKTWSIEGTWGHFQQGGDLTSRRKQFRTELTQPNYPHVRYQTEIIETEATIQDGYWLRHNGEIQGAWWILSPTIQYAGEHRKTEEADTISEGFRYDQWVGKLGLGKGPFTADFSRTVRDDRKYEIGFLQGYSQAFTDRMALTFRSPKGVHTSLMVTRRTRNYSDPEIQDQQAHLADAQIRFTPRSRLVEGSLNYKYSSVQMSQTVRDTVRVGQGLGNYRYDEDLDELVPDPDGDILLRTIQTGTFIPVNDLKLGFEFTIDGRRSKSKKGFLKKIFSRFRTRSQVRIERRDSERDFGKVNRAAFYPKWGRDSTMVTGLFLFHNNLEYIASSGFSVRLRYRMNDSENHQMAQDGLLRRIREWNLRLKGGAIKKTGILLEVKRRTESKDHTIRVTSNREICTYSGTLDFSYRPKQVIEIAVKSKFQQSKNTAPEPVQEATSFFVLPRFGYSFKGKGNLRAELEWGIVRAKSDGVTLPYEMLGGDQPGKTFRWTLLLTYRLSGHIMATINYRGRNEPWRDGVFQTGQVEVRAFF